MLNQMNPHTYHTQYLVRHIRFHISVIICKLTQDFVNAGVGHTLAFARDSSKVFSDAL